MATLQAVSALLAALMAAELTLHMPDPRERPTRLSSRIMVAEAAAACSAAAVAATAAAVRAAATASTAAAVAAEAAADQPLHTAIARDLKTCTRRHHSTRRSWRPVSAQLVPIVATSLWGCLPRSVIAYVAAPTSTSSSSRAAGNSAAASGAAAAAARWRRRLEQRPRRRHRRGGLALDAAATQAAWVAAGACWACLWDRHVARWLPRVCVGICAAAVREFLCVCSSVYPQP